VFLHLDENALTAEAWKKSPGRISTSSKLCSFLLYIQKFFSFVRFYQCPFLLCCSVNFSNFILHFFNTLRLVSVQFFLSNAKVSTLIHSSYNTKNQSRDATSIFFRCASADAFLLFSHNTTALNLLYALFHIFTFINLSFCNRLSSSHT